VITRQPAAENRFTVACPMPRLAPVRSMMRREVFDEAIGAPAGKARTLEPFPLAWNRLSSLLAAFFDGEPDPPHRKML
jgi:hypothetical protein